MGDKTPENGELSSETAENSQSEISLKMSPISYDVVPTTENARKELTKLPTPSPSSTTTLSPLPNNRTKPLPTSPRFPAYMSPSKPKDVLSDLVTEDEASKTMQINKKEGGNFYSCHSHRNWRSSLPPPASLFPLGDAKVPQNLENMPLSSYVKLMNLDVSAMLSPSYHSQNPIPGIRGNHTHSHFEVNSSLSGLSNDIGGHVTSSASHMAMNRAHIPTACEFSTAPPRSNLSMSQASTFLIPHPTNPGPGGVLTLHDSRSNSATGLGDMGPPLFSPSLPGDLNAVSSSSGNSFNMLSQAAVNIPTSSQQQTLTGEQPGPMHIVRLGSKRPHEVLLDRQNCNNTDPNFSPIMVRDTIFPPDNDCSTSRDNKEVEMKASQIHTMSGVMTENSTQQLKWQAHMIDSWMDICDGALQDIPTIGFQVETDKGFNFSTADDAFVCQKKNHFQVTVTIVFPTIPKFVKMKSGLIKPIDNFSLHLHGVKFEQITCEIKLEQSKSDRTKTKFEPEIIEITANEGEPIKKTLCRLHFSETTHNNMRKRGKPNPDQKYFSLVVSLRANTADRSYVVVAHVSERIIVRASNPGNFDNECDFSWLKCSNPEHIYHHGHVGINTDKPDEALCVLGNIQLTGQILQASDMRIKKNIKKVEQGSHLDNLSHLQLYEYQIDTSPRATQKASDYQQRDGTGFDITREWSTGRYQDWNTIYNTSSSNSNFANSSLYARNPCVPTRQARVSSQAGLNHGKIDDLMRGGNGENHLQRTIKNGRGRRVRGQGDSLDGTNCEKGDLRRENQCLRQQDRTVKGLLAQEIKEILPDAVMETETEVELVNGDRVKRLLVIDKDQILMETIGAVQELRNITNSHCKQFQLWEQQEKHNMAVKSATENSTNLCFIVQKADSCHNKSILDKRVGLVMQVHGSVLQWIIATLILAFLIIVLFLE